MLTLPIELDLLRELVATPSVSGDEEQVAILVENWAGGNGLEVSRDDTGVKVQVTGRAPGPALALVSHLDVVPPGEGWTRDPFGAQIIDGCMYGRGSGDAKASVAAMLVASLRANESPEFSGKLLVILGYGEETRHASMPRAVANAGRIDAAVIGEPTNLNLAVAQRGLMMIDLVARGDQRHAAYAGEGGNFTNSLVELSRDLAKLDGLALDRPHPILGQPTVTPTMVESGVSRNVTPPVARAIVDVRSTPSWTHAELADVLRRELRSEVVITSDRLVPCETPAGSRLLEAARNVRPAARRYGSPTCSDWVFLRDSDAIKCGPGTSRRSHTPDEFVELAEVSEAVEFYSALFKAYLS